MVCQKAKIFIDVHGSVITQHVAFRYFDVQKFVNHLFKEEGITMKVIFWKLWAFLQVLHCGVCDKDYIGAELGHCSYHP